MSNRIAGFVLVGLALAGFLFILIFPARIKAHNDSDKYSGWRERSLTFWRVIGAGGALIATLCLWSLAHRVK
jgi:hypothetical protein